MTNSEDMNPVVFKKMVNRKNRQISLAHILKSGEFQMHLSEKKQATALTTTGNSYEGELELVEGRCFFQLLQGGHLLRNNQHLLVMFERNNKSLYFQTVTGLVFPKKIELIPVAPRFYQRFKINGDVVVSKVPENQVEELTSGKKILTHYSSYLSMADKINYLSLDQVRTLDQGGMASSYIPSNCSQGSLVDLSQGGCHLSLDGKFFSELNDAKIVFVQFCLRIAGKINAVSCFCTVRELWQQDGHVLLRGEFLAPLNTWIGALANGSQDYILSFDEEIEADFNGIEQGKVENIKISLPYGTHALKVYWQNGAAFTRLLVINGATPLLIKIALESAESAVPKAG